MDGIDKILPSLPPWISIPVVLTSILITFGPKIYDFLSQFGFQSRAFKREKERLELLKLRYEVEALRKEKGLDLIADPLSVQISSLTQDDEREVVPSSHQPVDIIIDNGLSGGKRFLYGAFGGGFLSLIQWLLVPSRIPSNGTSFLFYLAATLLLATVAGFVTVTNSFVPKHRATAPVCFIIGLSVVLIVTAINQTMLRKFGMG